MIKITNNGQLILLANHYTTWRNGIGGCHSTIEKKQDKQPNARVSEFGTHWKSDKRKLYIKLK